MDLSLDLLVSFSVVVESHFWLTLFLTIDNGRLMLGKNIVESFGIF